MTILTRIWIAAVVFGVLAAPAWTQESPKPRAPTDNSPEAPPVAPQQRDFQVIPLKNAGAVEVSQLLGQLFIGPGRGPGRQASFHVVADANTNSLLIQATAQDLDAIRSILAKVDVARPDDSAKYSIFQLKNVEPDKSLENALKLIIGPQGFAVDRQRKTLVVRGDKRTSEAVQALLSRLEERPIRPPATTDVQVRVVWLVNMPAKEESPKDEMAEPPADLKSLLPDLAKLGIDRPRLAAQTLVNVKPDTEFRAAGRANLMGKCPFSVIGRYSENKDIPGLHLGIEATRERANASSELLGTIQTDITAPIGHMVVLGVMPTDTLTSVFVVQVLRLKGPGR